MKRNICVFCSSADLVTDAYFKVAEEVADQLAAHNDRLIYGGARIGLMGRLAKRAKACGVAVTGIIPQKIHDFGLGFSEADSYQVTEDMRSRKQAMIAQSDAFIALPGGFGTLEEFAEVLTLKQLGYHTKPLILVNVQNFYNPLLDFFESLYSKSFAKPLYREMYFVAKDAAAAFDYLQTYQPPKPARKWQ